MEDLGDSRQGLTILISALNEEKLIGLTIAETLEVARSELNAFEIILINDGSVDRTGGIMDHFAENNEGISVIHNPQARGLGQAFATAVQRACYSKIVLLTGDREVNDNGLRQLFAMFDSAELVIYYRENQLQARLFYRLIISKSFRLIMVILFGYKVHDFHGIPIYPVSTVRELDLQLIGYTFQVEVLVKLLRRNVDYVEMPFSINKEESGSSQVFRIKTFIDFAKLIAHLFRT
jgi:dolichol-phosphate mannosyltransferase